MITTSTITRLTLAASLAAALLFGGCSNMFSVFSSSAATEAGNALQARNLLGSDEINWDTDSVASNLVLSTSGANGTAISWSSSDATVATDGTLTPGTEDKVVTLTATITKGTSTLTKTFSVTVLAAPTPIASFGFAENADKTGYVITSFKGFTGSETTVRIPQKYEGKLITGVADSAFANNSAVTEVFIPNSVTSIGASAFASCPALSSVTVGSSDLSKVTSIGASAFSGSAKLASFTIKATQGTSPVALGASAFSGTSADLVIAVPVSSVDAYAGKTGWAALAARVEVAATSASTFTWTLDSAGTGYTLSAYSGTDAAVVIPRTYKNMPLTAIGSGAFQGNTTLASVELPATITSVGENAFKGSSLKSILLPDAVSSVGAGAFAGCASLDKVTIGTTSAASQSLSIGAGAWSGCTTLAEIVLVAVTPPTLVTGALEGLPAATTIAVPASRIASYSSASGWSALASNVEAGPTALDYFTWTPDSAGTGYVVSAYTGTDTVVVVPAKKGRRAVTEIAADTFKDKTAITSISLPDSVTAIGAGAFSGDSALATLVIDATTPPSLGAGALTGPAATLSIQVPFSATDTYAAAAGFVAYSATISPAQTNARAFAWALDSAGTGYVLAGYTGSDMAVIIPATHNGNPVTAIAAAAFQGKTLTSVDIPASVTSIGANAFKASSLTAITLPDAVSSIGAGAFANCIALGTVSIGTTSAASASLIIGAGALSGCTTLADIVLSATTTPILASGALDGLPLATTIAVPSALTATYGSASGWSVRSSSIEAGPTVASAFTWTRDSAGTGYVPSSYTGTDTVVVVPSRYSKKPVTEIAADTFKGNTAITSMSLPDSVTTIGSSAFANCSALAAVTIGYDGSSKVTSIGASAFSGDAALASLTIEAVTPPTLGAGALTGTPATLAIKVPLEAKATYAAATGFASYSSLISAAPAPAADFTWTLNSAGTGYVVSAYIGTGKAVAIPATFNGKPVTEIGESAFAGKSLTSVTVPDSVVTIASKAFANCTSLTSVTAGTTTAAALATIGSSAFSGDTALGSISFASATPPTILTGAFASVPSTLAVSVPASATTAYGTTIGSIGTVSASGGAGGSASSTDASLLSLAISSGSLSPTFAASTTSYTASVASDVTSLTLTPTVNQANATVKVNGNAVTSGSASGALSLGVGSNSIAVSVTAQDGSTTKTYAVTITREAAATATLSVRTQAGTVSAGTAGSVTFAVTSTNIASGTTPSFTWYASNAGTTTSSAPTGVTPSSTNITSGGADTITMTATSSAAAGTYYFKITYGSTASSVVTMTVGAAVSRVTTFAGAPYAGDNDGTGTAARFESPWGMAMDSSGNLFVADSTNNKIRKITTSGVVTTLAGSGARDSVDGTGAAAKFASPLGIAIDTSDNLYVTEYYGNVIRKITPQGVVSTIAGQRNVPGYVDDSGTAARFDSAYGLAFGPDGALYVADTNNNRIRKVTMAGVVTTFAGDGTTGDTDGTGTTAQIASPYGLAFSGTDLYVTQYQRNIIRKITPAGVVTHFAGSGQDTTMDGTGTAAKLKWPIGITSDVSGNLYVTENRYIRKITPAAVVTTLAGCGNSGFIDGTASEATFNQPSGIVLRDGALYVADSGYSRIRKVTLP